MLKKRGISPVIATVLLVVLVFVIAAIIFAWARGFVKEGVSKNGEPIDRLCDDIDFRISFDGTNLGINNQGNVELYGIDVKASGDSGGTLLSEEYYFSGGTLGPGESDSVDLVSELDLDLPSGGNLLIVPIILGEKNGGNVKYTCADSVGESTTI